MTDNKNQSKISIPAFKTEAEEAAWLDTHDVSEFWDELTPVNVRFELQKPKEENIVIRVQKQQEGRKEPNRDVDQQQTKL